MPKAPSTDRYLNNSKIPIKSCNQAGQDCNNQQDTIIYLTENDLGAFTVISRKISLAALSAVPRFGRGDY